MNIYDMQDKGEVKQDVIDEVNRRRGLKTFGKRARLLPALVIVGLFLLLVLSAILN